MDQLGPDSDMKSEGPDALADIDCVLEKLALKRVHMGDYLVIIRSNFDLTVAGEPYIATMLVINLWSKHFISRIWNKTVMTGSVRSKMEFEEVCNTLFNQGSPCLGCPVGGECFQLGEEEYVISQTPFPRRISKGCQQLIGVDINPDNVSCAKCLLLSDTDEEIGLEVKVETELDAAELGGKTNDAFNNEEASNEERDLREQEATLSEGKVTFDIRQKCDDQSASQKCQSDEAMSTENHDLGERTTEEIKEMDWQKVCYDKNRQGILYKRKEKYHATEKRRRPRDIVSKYANYCVFNGGKKEYRCDPCDKNYMNPESLATHLKVNHLWGAFQCMTCKKKEEYIENLQKHVEEAGHSQDALCPVTHCGKKFSLQEMRLHYEKCVHEWRLRKNGKMDTWVKVCEICGEKFDRVRAHDNHVAIKHPTIGETYYCDKCGKTFNNKVSLMKHRQNHNAEIVNYKLCNYSSPKRDMKNHMRVHEEAKFKCAICGKMLKSKFSLNIHEREHAGIKPFSCQVCGKSFPSNHSLKQHKRGVHRMVHSANLKPLKSELKKGIDFIIE